MKERIDADKGAPPVGPIRDSLTELTEGCPTRLSDKQKQVKRLKRGLLSVLSVRYLEVFIFLAPLTQDSIV